MKLSKIFKTQDSFARSVNLGSDLHNKKLSQQYIWGSTTLKIFSQILDELKDETKQGAVTLTGPFGTGKSAFTLQLLQLFGGSDYKLKEHALNKLSAYHPEPDYKNQITFNKPLLVLVEGKRSSIELSLIDSIILALKTADLPPNRISKFKRLLLNGERPSFKDIILTLDKLVKDRFDSILIVIDEFGKHLEFAAMNPSESDLYTLQELAELNKDQMSTQLLTLAILHQAFEDYANYLSQQAQNEWSKIQGRFRRLTLSEQPLQVLPLIAQAISCTADNGLLNVITKQADKIFCSSEIILRNISSFEDSQAINHLKQSFPIHPFATVALPYLAKIAGQNNRSCFTFLASNAPYSFPNWLATKSLENTKENLPILGIHDLYDYFSQSDRMNHSQNNMWLKAQQSLERIESENNLIEIQLIKSIAILNMLKMPKKLPASHELLTILFDAFGYSLKQVNEALESLKRQSILVYRKFSNEYRLWDGSDFSIEESMEKLRLSEKITNDILIEELVKFDKSSIFVAKRHYEVTGTLRHYAQIYLSSRRLLNEDINRTVEKYLEFGAEGLLIRVICTNLDDYTLVTEKLKSTTNPRYIFVVATPELSLFTMLKEYHLLNKLNINNSALSHDQIAQREVNDQLRVYEEKIQVLIQTTYWSFDGSDTRFFQLGKELKFIKNRKAFNRLLSDVFEQIYHKAPICKNELLNRHKISSSVSSARNNLLKKLITNRGQADLGFDAEDYSADATLYRIFLKKTGLYSIRSNGQNELGRPVDADWAALWDELDRFVNSKIDCDIPLTDLIKHFSDQPYGLRPQIFTLFFIAYIESSTSGLALYEEGTYQANRDGLVYEILVKRPHLYSVRKVAGSENYVYCLQAIAKALGASKLSEITLDSLYTIIKTLYERFEKLPRHTLNTRLIKPETQGFRDKILRANRPEELLFKTLPDHFEIPSADLLGDKAKLVARQYSQELLDELVYLENYYTQTIEQSFENLCETWNIYGQSISEKRRNLFQKFKRIGESLKEPILRTLYQRITNEALKDSAWLEQILGIVAGKNPKLWTDFDKNDLPNRTNQLYRKFTNYELMQSLTTKNGDQDHNLLRYSLSTSEGLVSEEVLSINPDEIKIHGENIKKITKALEGLNRREAKTLLLERLLQVLNEEEEWPQKIEDTF